MHGGVERNPEKYDTAVHCMDQLFNEEVTLIKMTRFTPMIIMNWCNKYSFLLLSNHESFTSTEYGILVVAVKRNAGVFLKTYNVIE